MASLRDTADVAREELLPLLEGLCAVAREEGQRDQEAFFGHIRGCVVQAREPEDLAGPFMELSTSAFRGFRFSPAATFLLDRLLALAQGVSMTLSASADETH